jgi:TonB-linked SusC/RagA family outer membrane protein
MKFIFIDTGRCLKKSMFFLKNHPQSRFIMRVGMLQIILLLCSVQLMMSKEVISQSLESIQVTIGPPQSDLQSLFKEIERQTNLLFAFQPDQISGYAVSLDSEQRSVKSTLDLALSKTPLAFRQINNNIVIYLKNDAGFPGEDEDGASVTFAQRKINVKGKVIDEDGNVMYGVTVLVEGTTNGTITDSRGVFSIEAPVSSTLSFTCIGMQKQEFTVSPEQTDLMVIMKFDVSEIGAVRIVSTGYQKIPQERSTGSFVLVDNELINRSVSLDVISRLDNITPGLLFDRRFTGTPTYSIRGLSTIQSDANPLIIVDNFPYEGDINNINPNDIESITVLKDAAASSIWGARAGNGVIVIITKTGRLEQPVSVQLNSHITAGAKPDLYYNKNFLNSSDFIEVERSLFEQGFFAWQETDPYYSAMSPVVELLRAERDGLVSTDEAESILSSWKNNDIRDDISKYMYRTSINQQHSLSLKGGGSQASYYVSGGFDKNITNLLRASYDRITVNSMLTYHPSSSLEVTSNLFYSNTNDKTNNNGGITGLSGKALYPYIRLADDNGNPLAVLRDYNAEFVSMAEPNGLLDWSYVPLDEMNNSDFSIKTNNVRINTAIRYKINADFNIEARYQFEQQNTNTRNLQSLEQYSTRDMINRFAYLDGSQWVFPVPVGGILDLRYSNLASHAGRLQANYNKSWKEKHQINALVGAEVRQVRINGSAGRFYGYDDNLLTYDYIDPTTSYVTSPSGSSSTIPTGNSLSEMLDRNVSFFGNASYSYKNRYMFSASARKDESNLFGVDANQKGVPLWSAGLGWRISSEQFYPFADLLPMMKFRATYGYSGNVNKSLTAYPTAAYMRSSETQLLYLQIQTPPNPSLRWEKVNMINLGVDFETKDRLISGSIEYYIKKGMDLIGRSPLDPTIGFNLAGRNEFIGNNSSLRGNGVDIMLNIHRSLMRKISWTAQLLYSFSADKVTQYDYESSYLSAYFEQYHIPITGYPRHSIYSIKWAGLDPSTGDPQVYINGEVTKDYSTAFSRLTMDDLVYNGPALPVHFGSVLNNFRIGDLVLGFNISYKLGYYFRRPSISYAGLYNSGSGNEDYTRRWQQPGDEAFTQVPSAPDPGTTSSRDLVYAYSDILVEKGDHIRFQDINISYEFTTQKYKKLPFSALKVYGYVNNIGILWRANKYKIDPDYIYQNYPTPRTYSLGVSVEF